MEGTTTRIADLPDNNNNSNMTSQNSQAMNSFSPAIPMPNSANPAGIDTHGGFEQAVGPTNYVPINVHSNPYGISAQNPIMSPPQQPQMRQSQNQPTSQVYIPNEQKMQLENLQHQRLPSRDIQHDTSEYAHDEQIRPNYVPRANVSSDYVRDYEDMTEKNLREYESKKQKESRLDMLFTELQTPLFVMLLFFIYQLPMINTLIFKKFSFLSLHTSDGNFNTNGLIFKSILFGAAFYGIQKMTTYLSEI
jgi:hypothetical protein